MEWWENVVGADVSGADFAEIGDYGGSEEEGVDLDADLGWECEQG